ncbi:MAG: site-specific integrase [Bacteroidetes bacterium]|nr:site-specific integrase [Bacteroidota bacterium]
MEITIARVLDKRHMRKKDKTYRLAIRVTYDRTPVPFPLDLYATEDDFKKFAQPKIGKELAVVREKLVEAETRAREIIRNLGTFTFQAFREEFYREKLALKKRKPSRRTARQLEQVTAASTSKFPLPNTKEGRNRKYGQKKFDRIRSNINFVEMGPVAMAFGEYIKVLESQDRIGTCENYFSGLRSLLTFRPNLRFEDISPAFLYAYEKWMLSKNNSYTTIGIYVRVLRAIFNIEIQDGRLSPKYYPFGKRKYVIPNGANVKKALDLGDIKKIYDYVPDPANANEGYARDIWLFGYYSNGINSKDIACLKFRNIDDGFIILNREKTKFSTRTKPRNIVIYINEDMQVIMDRWGNQDKAAGNYIFPVLSEGISAHRQYELVQGFTGIINDWMRVIAQKIGINKKVTTMAWRHTYATIMKKSGASTEYIQEAFGHTNVRTTENYLDSFDLETKKTYAKNLTAFKDLP